MRRRVLVAILLCQATAFDAWAEEPTAESREEQAAALIKAGVSLRMEGHEAAALARFRSAYAVFPSARAIGQMGLAAKSLRLYVDAEQYLQRAMADAADPWVVQNRDALEKARAVVASQLASLVLRSNAVGAEVWANGARVATLPRSEPIRVPAGTVRIELRATGYRSRAREATLPAGSVNALTIDLERAPEAALEAARPAATAPGPDRAAQSRLRPWIWTTLAIGSAGATAGAVLGGLTLATKSERDDVCPEAECPTMEGVELDEDVRAYATATTVTLAVGGAALAASLALWLFEAPSRPARASAWHAAPMIAPSAGGIGVGGRF